MADKEKQAEGEEAVEPEVVVENSEDIPGGVQTTDPAFANGAQEVDSWSNQPRNDNKKK